MTKKYKVLNRPVLDFDLWF